MTQVLTWRQERHHLSNRDFVKTALPAIISSMSIPLLGSVDTAIIGQLGDPGLIAGVSVGTGLLNTIYWPVGFLRLITSGLSAQCQDEKEQKDKFYALVRPLILAWFITLLILIGHRWLFGGYGMIVTPTDIVSNHAWVYYRILIWGTPFALMNYVMIGWLSGRGKMKVFMVVQIGGGLLNVLLDWFFVAIMHWSIEGVAIASLIAQVVMSSLILLYIVIKGGIKRQDMHWLGIYDKSAIKDMMGANGDYMIRTVCLMFVKNAVLAIGASLGTLVLAANAVLIQIANVMLYAFEGFGAAASLYAGRAKGSRNQSLMAATCYRAMQWGIVSAIFMALTFKAFDQSIVRLFTTSQNLIEVIESYAFWMLITPFAGFVVDIIFGIYTGTTQMAPMRNSAVLSMLLFFVAVYMSISVLGNNGLWLAQVLYWSANSVLLLGYLPGLFRKLFDLNATHGGVKDEGTIFNR